MSKSKDKKIDIKEIVYSQDEEKSFGDVFVYEPENIEEQNLGNLFIVGELKDLPRNCSYIMNVLASKIKKEFYTNTKRTAEESLEAGLSEANKTLADLAEQGNGEYVGKLSMICGTYHGSRFYLSQIGKIKSLLIRGEQIMEIVKENGSKRVSAKRAFNNIASGELSDGDLIIFATSGLFNIFSLEQLQQLGSSMKLDELSTKIQEEIEEADSETVSALLIEIEGEKKDLIARSEITLEKKEPVEKSLEKALVEGVELEEVLFEEEEKLAKAAAIKQVEEAAVVLAAQEEEPAVEEVIPEPIVEVEKPAEAEKEIAPVEKSKVAQKRKSPTEGETPPVPEAPVQSVIAEQEAAAVAVAENVGASAVKAAGKISLSDIIKEYEKMESKDLEQDAVRNQSIEDLVAKKESNNFEDLDEKEKGLPEKISANVNSYLHTLKNSKSKAVLSGKLRTALQGKKEYRVKGTHGKFASLRNKMIVGVLLLTVVGGGYYYSSVQGEKEKAAQAAEYQVLLDQSKAKMDQAEVESISGSEGNASKLFIEARTLALRVKDEYDALDTQADEIIANAQTQIDVIDKVVRADGAEVVANFENENIKNLVDASGTYYVVDGNENAIYEVDAAKSEISQVVKAQEPIGNLSFAKNFQSQEILLADGSEFLSFNLKNSQLQKLSTKADNAFTDFATYGRYIYLLSPASNQIYKYQKSDQSLDSETEWLKSGDIGNAVSLAIDQYVYILTSDGQVKKYYTGEELVSEDGSKFAIKQPSDAITNPTGIYTSTDQKYLYIAEPSKNRIALFDKTSGALIKQVVSDEFSDIRDIFVDAEEGDMAVLVKNKIVKIDLTK
ncbi:MAG: hypothetical protein PHX30_05745 [Candidatus Pacebacteria bacterium]|nr:hypothetical protein [Candidatus Paceibacterota bacterium]